MAVTCSRVRNSMRKQAFIPPVTTSSSFVTHRSSLRSLSPSNNSPNLAPRHAVAPICGMGDAIATPFVAPEWPKLASYTIPQDYVNGPPCASPTKELQSFRLFGQKEADVRLVFYRDHAGWCPYCHKVQMLLEGKRIPYLIKKVNMSCYGTKPAEFLKKVPTGLLPVIELDGKIITESMDIMFLLEDTFQMPYRRMIPTDDNDMMQSFHRYLRLERVFIGAWLGCLRGPMSMIGRGMEPVHQALDLIEQGLGQFAGPYFYPGDEPTFVDINFCKFHIPPSICCTRQNYYPILVGKLTVCTVFLIPPPFFFFFISRPAATIFERARSSLKYWRNLEITEGRPSLKKWFEHWDSWPPASYLRSDDWTHIGALPPQIGPVRFGKIRTDASYGVETARQRHVLNDGPERKMERNVAAATICRNSTAVVKDAIKGGKVPEEYHVFVDKAFRIMAQVLFDPDLLEVLEEYAKAEIPKKAWSVVGDAVRFERARCCSPRDMPIRSMEQFCGGINWFLRTLGQDL